MKLSIVALKVTRYSDAQSILTAYSRELGMVSLALPAGSSRSAVRMRALTMPFGVAECESDLRFGREVLNMRQLSQTLVLRTVHVDPVKRLVAMFVSELLAVVLRGGGADEVLYDFLVSSIAAFDKADARAAANFHICFLYHLGRHLGIEPDVSTYVDGAVFDMSDGVWRRSVPMHKDYLVGLESVVAYRLSRMTFGNMGRFGFSRRDRNAIIDRMLGYFSLHCVSLRNVRSLGVVRDLL